MGINVLIIAVLMGLLTWIYFIWSATLESGANRERREDDDLAIRSSSKADSLRRSWLQRVPKVFTQPHLHAHDLENTRSNYPGYTDNLIAGSSRIETANTGTSATQNTGFQGKQLTEDATTSPIASARLGALDANAGQTSANTRTSNDNQATQGQATQGQATQAAAKSSTYPGQTTDREIDQRSNPNEQNSTQLKSAAAIAEELRASAQAKLSEGAPGSQVSGSRAGSTGVAGSGSAGSGVTGSGRTTSGTELPSAGSAATGDKGNVGDDVAELRERNEFLERQLRHARQNTLQQTDQQAASDERQQVTTSTRRSVSTHERDTRTYAELQAELATLRDTNDGSINQTDQSDELAVELRRLSAELTGKNQQNAKYLQQIRDLENQLKQQNTAENSVQNVVQTASSKSQTLSSRPAMPARPAGKTTTKKPVQALFTRPDETDDLKRVKGIGPVMERTLNELGVTTFKQLAEFQAEDIQRVSDALEVFPGRIERDEWVPQAAELYQKKILQQS